MATVLRSRKRKSAKDLSWMGSSREDLIRLFPEEVRKEAGKELRSVQFGEEPKDADGLSSAVGHGAFEIRFRDKDGWYRVILVTKFEKSIYVLHAFKKKTNQTSDSDIQIAKSRYAAAKKDAGVK
ncbi:type II toxin-antitoxin system RelE/ParE family toxin [Xanthomonas campestris pv. uppalii]|uniref:type II toxin-antitoxin system RelE/ParE family toxin n=1 Tax=Xanthomonas euvesicatoria TaxID=456327 RepID=UPI001C48FEE7|nr:type II toxin-antitoxin system RelE/ParE family toxin [Xanthomonas euvesicatoria]MBV6785181.1 type II toxin-antitoxin system RelE/ParE family toxin [Xanthomonas campestris pv. uppalii]